MTDCTLIDNYDLATKQRAIEMNMNGSPIFEVSVQMKVPVSLIVKWVKNKSRILSQKTSCKRKPSVKPNVSACPLRSSRQTQSQMKYDIPDSITTPSKTCPSTIKRRSRSSMQTCPMIKEPVEENYDIPCDICPKETEQEEEHIDDEFKFEYDVPYKRRVWINGRMREVIGIVPKPKEALFTGDLFDDRFSTIKSLDTNKITLPLPEPPEVEFSFQAPSEKCDIVPKKSELYSKPPIPKNKTKKCKKGNANKLVMGMDFASMMNEVMDNMSD